MEYVILSIALACNPMPNGLSPSQPTAKPTDQLNARIWKRTCDVALRVKGRFLGSFIRKGMPIEEVEQILGKGFLGTYWSTGGNSFGGLDYDTLGLSIDLHHYSDEPGWLRVDRVSFKSLLGDLLGQ
jgi:hypothetical protein